MGVWSSGVGASFDRKIDNSDAGYRKSLIRDIIQYCA